MVAFAEHRGPTANATPTMSMPSRKKIRGLTAGSRSCREEGNPPVCPASVHQSRFVLSPKEARTALRLTRTPAGVSMIDPPVLFPARLRADIRKSSEQLAIIYDSHDRRKPGAPLSTKPGEYPFEPFVIFTRIRRWRWTSRASTIFRVCGVRAVPGWKEGQAIRRNCRTHDKRGWRRDHEKHATEGRAWNGGGVGDDCSLLRGWSGACGRFCVDCRRK